MGQSEIYDSFYKKWKHLNYEFIGFTTNNYRVAGKLSLIVLQIFGIPYIMRLTQIDLNNVLYTNLNVFWYLLIFVIYDVIQLQNVFLGQPVKLRYIFDIIETPRKIIYSAQEIIIFHVDHIDLQLYAVLFLFICCKEITKEVSIWREWEKQTNIKICDRCVFVYVYVHVYLCE